VFFTVCVFINHNCRCGPVLVSSLVARLPSQFGPASIRRVLRQTLQATVDCSEDQSTVFSLLKEGTGRVIISGLYCIFSVTRIFASVCCYVCDMDQLYFISCYINIICDLAGCSLT